MLSKSHLSRIIFLKMDATGLQGIIRLYLGAAEK
jgi:hypothetical protein